MVSWTWLQQQQQQLHPKQQRISTRIDIKNINKKVDTMERTQ
jgi:hypothetical protein